MELFDLITPDTTLLTPNRRLAAAFHNQYNLFQQTQNKSCWLSLDILPLSSWIKRLWDEISAKTIASHPILLTDNQETLQWETLLRASPESDSLLQVTATAKLAMSAWELLKLWQVDLDHPVLSYTTDGQVFQQWAKQFQQRGQKNNWIDRNSLFDIILQYLSEKKINLPKQIILVGFTEISPLHQHLLNQCEKHGAKIIHHHATHRAKIIKKIALADEENEIRAMARFAKAMYENSPQKTTYLMGCVVPHLESMRDQVLKFFSETFSENNSFTLDHTSLPFNISAGKNLSSFPVVHAALELLSLAQHSIPIETVSSLLRSPFIGDAEQEQLSRAYFENNLRKENITTITLEHLLKPDFGLSKNCPALAKRIKKYLNALNENQKTLPISVWVKHFSELLTIMGWPGERSLNSQEYQVTQRWLDLLAEYRTFDHVLGPQSFSKAVDYLAQLSAKAPFQSQSPDAPIHILGVLEAAELPFHYLWVMGFDDVNWPAAPKPNPFIPQSLQKTLHMPHATSERELAYCEKLMQQLQQSAEHIIFSYAQKNEEMDLRPSALLNLIPEIYLTEIAQSSFSSPAQIIFSSKILEALQDETAPSIQPDEEIRGGTRIFKLQAACPFKAFAELRLHARHLETPTLGLRALDRGNIVHKALEFFWREIKDSATLTSLSESQLKKIIHESSTHALQTVLHDEQISHRQYLLLELQRLEKLLFDWLTLESTRPAFKVAFQEYETKVVIGNIPVTLRIDRIDELDDGNYLIIDYKTGKNSLKSLFGARPDEPQLPLYCIVSDKKTYGIAFGQIHPDELVLLGTSKINIDIKSIKTLPEISYATATLWDAQVQEWQVTLEKLAQDFHAGVARVDPKDVNSVCNPCRLHSFCRVQEK